jgi:HK97 gp10 family phage protein
VTGVRGLDRLKRQLLAVPEAQRRALSRRLEDTAGKVRDAIRRAAPRIDGVLQASIDYRQGQVAPANAFLAANNGGASGSVKGELGLLYSVTAGNAEAFYARWVEFGTNPHSLYTGANLRSKKHQFRGASHPGARANPFFFSTIRELRGMVHRGVVGAANEGLRSVRSVR